MKLSTLLFLTLFLTNAEEAEKTAQQKPCRLLTEQLSGQPELSRQPSPYLSKLTTMQVAELENQNGAEQPWCGVSADMLHPLEVLTQQKPSTTLRIFSLGSGQNKESGVVFSWNFGKPHKKKSRAH